MVLWRSLLESGAASILASKYVGAMSKAINRSV
jgi:hypothetical protein